MKQPKRLTRSQKECLTAHHLNAKDWALVEEMDFYLRIIHKETEKTRIVDKYRRMSRR